MSTATPRSTASRRSLESLLELPPIRDVRPPGWIARRPRWLVASIVLIVLLAIAGFLHSRQLSGELWFNEAIATGFATQSFGGLLHAVRDGGSAPLYYVLLHFWVNAFGDGETATHGLSLLFGLLTIPAAGWIGWSLGGPRAGLYAAILFTFSAYLVKYSQETQPYALLMLLGLLAAGGFLQGFVYRRRRWLWLFAVALEAALYTQLSAALLAGGLLVAVGVVWWLAEPEARGAIARDAALCFGGVLVFYVPWLPSTIHQIEHATSPWRYAPLVGATVPANEIGSERVDAALLVGLVVGAAPLMRSAARRRRPESVALAALAVASVLGFAAAKLAETVSPSWNDRYFGPMAATLLLLAALGAARARLVGLVAVLLSVAFTANPAAYAPPHKSNLRDVRGELAPLLHPGDAVAIGDPAEVPLAAYYLPAGLRFWSTLGPSRNPTLMDWNDARARLARAAPAATLGALVASLRPGQQLLYVRPLTEGAQNWKAPWPDLVRRRSAQWGQILIDDAANGTLVPIARAPHSYPSACCVADSAILYRKR